MGLRLFSPSLAWSRHTARRLATVVLSEETHRAPPPAAAVSRLHCVRVQRDVLPRVTSFECPRGSIRPTGGHELHEHAGSISEQRHVEVAAQVGHLPQEGDVAQVQRHDLGGAGGRRKNNKTNFQRISVGTHKAQAPHERHMNNLCNHSGS